MSQAQLKFRCLPERGKFRNHKDVQKSVNKLFVIFEEYGRLEQKLTRLKNQSA